MDTQPDQHFDAQAGQDQEAHESPRRNTEALQDVAEDTPLLDNGGGSGDERNGGDDWEGAADSEGLSWWRTPAVTLYIPITIINSSSKLTR
jgi:hypothetical protein